MTSILDKAKFLAINYHRGQQYGNFPYTQHLWDVERSIRASHSWPAWADETNCERMRVTLAVGWLHDVLEDTECTRQEIRDEFGPEILHAVVSLSKNCFASYEHYIVAVKSNPTALEVKIHDTLCNLTHSVRNGEKGRVRKYANQLMLLVED